MNATIVKFLDTLRGVRTHRQSSVVDVYWHAAEALANGREPTCKPSTLAEAMERLGMNEADLERDAQTLAEVARVKVLTDGEAVARARLKDAATARGNAEIQARELERQANAKRAAADAVVHAASNETTAAQQARSRLSSLRHSLAERGHPQFVVEARDFEKAREVNMLRGELEGLPEGNRARRSEVRDLLAALGDRVLEEADVALPVEPIDSEAASGRAQAVRT